MSWKDLTSTSQIKDIISESKLESNKAVLIFKHSTRCSVSFFAKKNFDADWSFSDNFPAYYLDLIANRDVSNQLAETFDVIHQSPQVLVIKNGKCIYSATHGQIDATEILAQG